jgi:RNA polymerase sigma factor (sigma-70 family)
LVSADRVDRGSDGTKSMVAASRRGVDPRGTDAIAMIPTRADDDFTDFYRDAYPAGVRLAWLLTHDHAAAEDVVQDAFVRLRPRLHTVEHRVAYLRTAIVNGCRDRARSAGRADSGLRRMRMVVPASSTDQPCELVDAVGHLPYKQRAVLVLRYWADLPEREIAEIVGVRPATVRSITARALAQLRKELPDGH